MWWTNPFWTRRLTRWVGIAGVRLHRRSVQIQNIELTVTVKRHKSSSYHGNGSWGRNRSGISTYNARTTQRWIRIRSWFFEPIHGWGRLVNSDWPAYGGCEDTNLRDQEEARGQNYLNQFLSSVGFMGSRIPIRTATTRRLFASWRAPAILRWFFYCFDVDGSWSNAKFRFKKEVR